MRKSIGCTDSIERRKQVTRSDTVRASQLPSLGRITCRIGPLLPNHVGVLIYLIPSTSLRLKLCDWPFRMAKDSSFKVNLPSVMCKWKPSSFRVKKRLFCCSVECVTSFLIAAILLIIIFITSGALDQKLIRLSAQNEDIETLLNDEHVLLTHKVKWAPMNRSNWFLMTEDQIRSTESPMIEFSLRRPSCGESLLAIVYVLSMPHNFERRQAIRESWAKQLHPLAEIRFVLGRSNATIDSIFRQTLHKEQHLYDDLLHFAFEDIYELLSIKTLAILRHSRRHCPHVPFTIKCDDDVYLNWSQLSQLLWTEYMAPTRHEGEPVTKSSGSIEWQLPTGNKSRSNSSTIVQPQKQFKVRRETSEHFEGENKMYCLRMKEREVIRRQDNQWFVPYSLYANSSYPEYCNGPMYVMGNETVRLLLDAFPHTRPHLYLEDVLFTGLVRQTVGERIRLDEPANFVNLKPYEMTNCEAKKFISHHSIGAINMRRLWYQIQNAYETCD